MRLGLGVAADKPTVAAAIRVIIAPLGQAIDQGQFSPGSKLPSARLMTQHWGVSKFTLIEAQAEALAPAKAETAKASKASKAPAKAAAKPVAKEAAAKKPRAPRKPATP